MDGVQQQINIPRVLLAGTGSNIGTSTILLGLLVAFKRQGVTIAAASLGSSLVDTTLYRRVSGRLAHTLFPWYLSQEQRVNALARQGVAAELVLLEGIKGVYDNLSIPCGLAHQGACAAELGTPLILVVDAAGYSESISALVQGFIDYYPTLAIGGVIANRVCDEAHDHILRQAIEGLGGPYYLGGIPVADELLHDFRAQQGVQQNVSLVSRSKLLGIGELVESNLNMTLLQHIAAKAGVISVKSSLLSGASRRCRIAVADDAAFHLTIQDNLDLLRRLGAELVAFSPLTDSQLPQNIGGLYLPGGYIPLYSDDLQSNKQMLNAIRSFAKEGGVIYAESGAIMYLCRKLIPVTGKTVSLCGLIPGNAHLVLDEEQCPQQVFCEVTMRRDSVIGAAGMICRGFRESSWLIRLEEQVQNCFEVRSPLMTEDEESVGTPVGLEGLAPAPNILATGLNLHWGSYPAIAEHFVSAAQKAGPPLVNDDEFEDEENLTS